MKKLTIFYLEGCPYCRRAAEAVRELQAEDPSLEAVGIEWIEETVHPEIADLYDYYRVPSIYLGDEKLYECSPGDGYGEIRRRAEQALRLASESDPLI